MAGPGNNLADKLADLNGFNEEDTRRTILGALRLLLLLCAVGVPIAWWRAGWQSGVLLLVGAAISGSGVWELYRVMAAMMERMDQGATPKPVGRVMLGFFLRLSLSVAALYASLRYLHGSVFALAAGLALGVVSLTVEALRLLKAWTV